LLLGRLGAATVIGLPGCARSEKRSGFDWILERSCAGVAVDGAAIAAMGVGGLLDDIAARPAPRDGEEPAPQRPAIAAIVLAAGRATRMGANKLLAELDGVPIVRHAVTAALASRARPVVVVTGHQRAAVEAALAGLDVRFADNPDHEMGMAGSLRAGLGALPAAIDGALICLGDMPRIRGAHLDAIMAGFEPGLDGSIVVPTCERKRGNPVLWARRYFAEMASLEGDVGARGLLARYADQVRTVAIDDPAILLDVDTPEALAELRGRS
jgi:molybdenum cofactor cytidylyltransferase